MSSTTSEKLSAITIDDNWNWNYCHFHSFAILAACFILFFFISFSFDFFFVLFWFHCCFSSVFIWSNGKVTVNIVSLQDLYLKSKRRQKKTLQLQKVKSVFGKPNQRIERKASEKKRGKVDCSSFKEIKQNEWMMKGNQQQKLFQNFRIKWKRQDKRYQWALCFGRNETNQRRKQKIKLTTTETRLQYTQHTWPDLKSPNANKSIWNFFFSYELRT